MMRRTYDGWVSSAGSPFDPASRVFPPPDLSPAEADAAMRGFAQGVLAAAPRPFESAPLSPPAVTARARRLCLLPTRFPEMLNKIILVNAPAALASIFTRIVKPFMDPITAAKVELHSGVPLDRHFPPFFLSAFPADFVEISRYF